MIDVSKNLVTHISKQAFKDLYLADVILSHNEISSIESGAFENCINLTTLDLSYNNITGFVAGAFDINSYAGVLDLSHNAIKNLSKVCVSK